ncbi:hypothetical protein B0H11DRAFT_2215346 [Mycena galericulata]|nr:hypothetical protein B0H11DRAFT_2215346 [Mycena galericulata]
MARSMNRACHAAASCVPCLALPTATHRVGCLMVNPQRACIQPHTLHSRESALLAPRVRLSGNAPASPTLRRRCAVRATTKYARTPDLGTRFPLSESRAPPTNNAAHEIHHIYTASTANDDGPWTPGTLQLLPFYHYNIDSIRQLLSGPLGRASPGNEDLLYAFIPRLHTIARASAPYNNDIEITNLTIAPPKLFRRPAAHRPRASLAPQQTGCAQLD